jgi:hypothetical protein
MFEELNAPKLPFDQFFLGKRSPFSTSGEKVAVSPDEGAFVEGSVLKHPPHPSPLPQFFARTLPCDTPAAPAKNRGRGGNMALSS